MKEIQEYPGYYITEYVTIYCNNPINGIGELRSSEMRLLKHKINYSGCHQVTLYNKVINQKGIRIHLEYLHTICHRNRNQCRSFQ